MKAKCYAIALLALLPSCVSPEHKEAVETMTPVDALFIGDVPYDGDAALVWAIENMQPIKQP